MERRVGTGTGGFFRGFCIAPGSSDSLVGPGVWPGLDGDPMYVVRWPFLQMVHVVRFLGGDPGALLLSLVVTAAS